MAVNMNRSARANSWNVREVSVQKSGPTAGVDAGGAEASRLDRLGLRLLSTLLRSVIRKGTLTLIAPSGEPCGFGHGTPRVTIRVTDWSTVQRLWRDPDMAFGEAYMDGTLLVEGGSIHDFLDLCLANIGWGYGDWMHRAWALARRAMRRVAQFNPAAIARANVAHHYDLSDELYGLFLDPGRQYSCAYFDSPDDTLERAQERKKRHLAAKLLLKPGQHVLDIGSGWGGLAMELASAEGVDVTGVTLSKEQLTYARTQVKQASLADRVRFRLLDYRQLEGRFDRVVSVGMFEHVGVGHYPEFFRKLKRLLADDGVALLHFIGRADGAGTAHAWLNKYIFPGGYTPALSEVVPVIERAGLYITDIEILRLHYAETLKAWRQRFEANRERVAEIYDQRFCRMWEFYLACCEASFQYSGLVVFQIQLSKRIDAVPITRDYIMNYERNHRARREEG